MLPATDVDIHDDFTKRLAEQLQPDTSALFVLVKQATPDRVVPRIRQYGGTILQTSLMHEDEQKLQAALEQAQTDG